jgi:sulfane dehydrogenase subunit SoxC
MLVEQPGPGEKDASADGISMEELQLAARNHGMPLEALRYEATPVGLHYLLIHYDIPPVDPTAWRLEVGGQVSHPLALSLDEVRARHRVDLPVTFECAGNGRAQLDPRPISQPWLVEAVGTAIWTGTPLRELLDDAGLRDDAVAVAFTGLDRGLEGGVEQNYERGLTLAWARRPEVLLAYEINGQPLPPQHGFPLRLVVPGWYGMANVKWLQRITVLDRDYAGYQNVRAYRYRSVPEEEGTMVTRMVPRSLMVPPGIPDFMSRVRYLDLRPCQIEGRAWSGWGRIDQVEVSVDGGHSWAAAILGDPPSPYAWTPWWYQWNPAEPGDYELCCRARDSHGNEQPAEPSWNLGGYSNNKVQRVRVVVRPPAAPQPASGLEGSSATGTEAS